MSNGKMPDMGALMKQAQRMQADVAKAQEEIARLTVEGAAGGGMVTAVVNGQFEVVSIKIEKEVVDPNDIGMLQDLVLSAINNAGAKMREASATRMNSVMGGMKIPGMPGF